PTLMLTRSFDWSGRRWGELTDLIFQALARRGTAYLLNGYASNVEALYAMCCRLTIDVTKLPLKLAPELEVAGAARVRGSWALPDGTGSIGIVTVNLPRLAALSKGEWDKFEELLRSRLELARQVLLAWRRRYERIMLAGLTPITKTYLGHLHNHFNTFGLIGLPEAAANFLRNPKLWSEGSRREMRRAIDLEKRIVELVRRYAEECEAEDGCLYNVEEIPGESTGYRLASMDARLFKDRDDVLIPSDGVAPFYSNSIVPYYADVPIHQRALWEGEVQQEFTGGVMMHLFLEEQPDPDALKRIVRRIAENTRVVYFSITPTISVCRRCGWSSVGTYWECPRCGYETDVWSRIVGYYRPVRSWNPGKKAEFKLRQPYRLSM
ncbi:MAG: anaerobic ribonucleoside-triphosphate reductase, partial [Thermoproteales archaeon]|nr:anaerobic ribonucleoside-triphosphate reductase [Thermoproteales archaeon]